MTSLFTLLPATVNHLLAQESWARAKLLRHAGKIARLDGGLAAVVWQVAADGLLQLPAADAKPDVTIRVKPADLPMIAQDPSRAVAYATIEGDADFANTISQLAQSLKWDAEEDLSKLVGDMPARRLVGTVRQVVAGARRTQQALAENVAEYFLDENPMLVRPHMVGEFAQDVVRLRDDLERLEKRLQKLSK